MEEQGPEPWVSVLCLDIIILLAKIFPIGQLISQLISINTLEKYWEVFL